MGVKKVTMSKKVTRERFVFETDNEREILEKARDYFGSAALLLKNCGYLTRKKSCCSLLYIIKKGSKDHLISISVENWKKIKDYASRFDEGKRYEPELHYTLS